MSDWNVLQIAAGRVLFMADELQALADQCTTGGGRAAIMDVVTALKDAEGSIGDQLREESLSGDD